MSLPALADPVARLLGPGGALAGTMPGYEARASQLAFARDVAETLDRGRVLLAEAPTGVGKSLGYLVPALLWSRHERAPVVISTHTKQLQSQLTEVDLPRLFGLFDPPPRVTRLKGKANYVCPRRWKLHVAEQTRKGSPSTRAERAVHEWIEDSPTGDLDEFDFGVHPGGHALRTRIACEATFCQAASCRPECPWRRARRQAASSEIVVVNHALLVTGLPGSGVLPPYRALIVDEAHHLDPVFTSQSTVRQSLARLETVFGPILGGGRRPAGLLAELGPALEARLAAGAHAELADHVQAIVHLAPPLREAARVFFTQVAASLAGEPVSNYEPRARFLRTEDLVAGDFAPLERVFRLGREAQDRWSDVLSVLGRAEATPEVEELTMDAVGAAGAWQEWLASLQFVTDPRDREFVHWRGGARAESAELAAAPVEIARRVQQSLLPELHALVLASATLATGGSFRFVRERLGLVEEIALDVRETVYPSPFDFARQLGAWTVEWSDPAQATSEALAVAGIVSELASRLRRNTLVLFTSHLALRATARHLAPLLGDAIPLHAQDVDGTAVELARRFAGARGVVLLGVASFWEGVDFPGAALEVLVVTRLPFSVPTDPLIEARCERIEAAGESGFARALLPEAVLRFRQGVGRLVRRASDRGVVAILDPRVTQSGYGAHFRRALPVELRRARSGADLAEQAAAFFDEGDG